MEYEKLKLNFPISEAFFFKYKKYIKKKRCYDNIAKIVMNMSYEDIQKFKDIKIVFGAIEIFPENYLYAKHCFFKIKDEAIDPTFFLLNKKTSPKYIEIKSFSINEYFRALEDCDYYSDLHKIMNPIFEKAVRELNDIILCG